MSQSRLTIGIDARSITGLTCGVSRVAGRLIEALSRADARNRYVVFTRGLASWPGLGPNFTLIPAGVSWMNPLGDVRLSALSGRQGVEIFHSLHSWLPLILPRGTASIVTIHDTFAATDARFFEKRGLAAGPLRWWFGLGLSSACRRATAIVTVSEASARAIGGFCSQARGKIFVVPNGPGLGPELASGPRGTRPPYLLYVGNCRSYKDPETLVRGFAEYRRARALAEGLRLVMAGNDTCEGIVRLAADLGLSAVIEMIRAPSDEELSLLYKDCHAVVCPSRDEGFGIPALEGMAFGKPVISSDAEALLEVAGGASAVFPKGDAAALARLILRVEDDAAYYRELSALGALRAPRFSWDRSAAELLAVYREVGTSARRAQLSPRP